MVSATIPVLPRCHPCLFLEDPAEVVRICISDPDPDLTDYFNHVGKCKAFLDKDFEGLISENEEWVRNEQSGKSNQGVARYEITDPKTQARIPMHSASDLTHYFTHTNKIGLFEPALYSNIPKGGIKTPEGLAALKNYVRTTLETYVKSSIDLYFDAKEAGKLEDFVAEIISTRFACMDNRAEFTIKTRMKLDLFADAVSDSIPMHDKDTPISQCIYEEIRVIFKKSPELSWKDPEGRGNDVESMVKKALIGKIRPIGTLNEMGTFVPLMEDGKPVVRAITEADIDKVGTDCARFAGYDV